MRSAARPLLLVSGATATVRRYAHSERLGHLLTPHNGNALRSLLATGLPIGVDNACFGGLDKPAITKLVRTFIDLFDEDAELRFRFLWFVVPDVVGDHRATLEAFGQYAGLIAMTGIPLAFVAQDGCEPLAGVPWSEARCIFIGGSTEWKESAQAARIVREAKRRHCWVHVGRINTERRLRLFDALGVDSFDGTQFSMFPDTYIPRWLDRLTVQQRGFLEVV